MPNVTLTKFHFTLPVYMRASIIGTECGHLKENGTINSFLMLLSCALILQ